MPEISKIEEVPSLSLNTTKKTSQIIQKSHKKDISNKSINKSSYLKSPIPTTTPKQKQLIVQNHYLNKEKNSYAALNKQKKQENTQSYNKLVNASNIDLKIEKSALGNNSLIISPLGKFRNNESKIKAHFTQNSKDSAIKGAINSGFKKKNMEEKKQENDAFEINLNLNIKNFKNKEKEKELSKENIRSENFYEIKEREMTDQNQDSCEDSGDEILFSNVKEDIENLKNKMAMPEIYVKSPIETQGTFVFISCYLL